MANMKFQTYVWLSIWENQNGCGVVELTTIHDVLIVKNASRVLCLNHGDVRMPNLLFMTSSHAIHLTTM